MKSFYAVTLLIASMTLLTSTAPAFGVEQLDRVISMTGGGSTLSYNIATAMKSTGVSTTATGKVKAKLTRKGTAINEQLTIQLLNLVPNSPYQLMAFIGDSATPTLLNGFTTNADGTFTSAIDNIDFAHIAEDTQRVEQRGIGVSTHRFQRAGERSIGVGSESV